MVLALNNLQRVDMPFNKETNQPTWFGMILVRVNQYGHVVITYLQVILSNIVSGRYRLIGQVGIVFPNGPGDLGSIPGWVIPKTQKWYLIPPCLTLSNIRYVSRVKWSNPGKGVAPSPTPRCSSYWKGSLLVALDYGCQLTHSFW